MIWLGTLPAAAYVLVAIAVTRPPLARAITVALTATILLLATSVAGWLLYFFWYLAGCKMGYDWHCRICEQALKRRAMR